MRIIMGESMGGAMALRLHRKKPDYWDGAVLVAPMCKVVRKRTLFAIENLDEHRKLNFNIYLCLIRTIYICYLCGH